MNNKSRLKGYTLVEAVVVLFIISISALAATPPIINYYKTTVVESELKSMVSVLRRARQLSISNNSGANYSIKFFATRYVMFSGTTYVEGAPGNVQYDLSSTTETTTFSNNLLTFQSFSGKAAAAGNILITAFGISHTVILNSLGVVQDIT